jgi:spore coat protein JB
MSRNDGSRQDMLRRIQAVSFVLVEINLYLNTHPNDRAALDYYHKYAALMDQLNYEYAHQYGPLSARDVVSSNRWTWIDQPWPWEKEA